MNRITTISVIVSIIFLIFVLQQVRKKRLSEAYSLLWIFAAVILIILAMFPSLLSLISNFLGIYYAPATLFLILILCILLILLQFSILLTIRSRQIKKIAQEVALLKNELEKLPANSSNLQKNG
jgi:hypothetical protein